MAVELELKGEIQFAVAAEFGSGLRLFDQAGYFLWRWTSARERPFFYWLFFLAIEPVLRLNSLVVFLLAGLRPVAGFFALSCG